MKNTAVRRNTLVVVMIASFLTTFNTSSLNLSIPNISLTFNVSAQSIGWLITTYTLCNVALALPFGKIADMTSRLLIFRIGTLVFTVGTLCAGLAGSFYFLLGMRFVQGVGASMLFATTNAILLNAFEPHEKGKVLGFAICATYIGLSAGPVIGGLINGFFGWRAVMFSSTLVSLIAVIFAFSKLHDERIKNEKSKLDVKGIVLYAVGISALMYGLSEIGSGSISYILIIAGIILLIAFVMWENKCENTDGNALIKLSLFRNTNFTYSNLAAMMNYAATYAVSYFMSIYLQVVRGYTSQTAGLILVATPLIQALLSPYAGKLSDKHSPYKLSSYGMACCALSLIMLIFINETTSIYIIIPILAFLGLGFALFSSPNTNAIMSSAGKENSGIASSIVATMRNIGQTLSMSVITITVGLYVGSNTSINNAGINAIISTMHCIFIIFSIICIIGIFLSSKRK